MADSAAKPVVLWASSCYGAKTREPLVTIHWQDVVQQITPNEARSFAFAIIVAAEASEQDAFLFETVKAKGLSDEQASGLLIEFRSWRERRERGVNNHDDGETL